MSHLEEIALLALDARAIERVTGRPGDDRIGRNAFASEFIHPDDRERFALAQRRVLAGEQDQAAQPVQRLRLDLHDRGGLAGVQALMELLKQVGVAGEGGIARRQVGHQRPHPGLGQLVEDRGRCRGWQVNVDGTGAARLSRTPRPC